jgi:glycosyltransferase involved in cell wall biosynthesis
MSFQVNKNNKNLSTVIICFLNAEKFIQEAIEGVFAQTYSNWELLLIDDGSVDGSTKIARQYAEQYPQKVTYLEHANHKNLGLSASRNIGINKSNGEYIAFLDADDVWLSQKLKEQIAIMRAYPEVAMTYGPTFFWYSWTGKPEDKRRDYLERLTIGREDYNTIIKPPVLLKKFVNQLGVEPCTSDLMIRREMLSRIGGFEESFSIVVEDLPFYVKVFLSESVFISQQVWLKYRQHQDSACHLIDKQEYRAALMYFWKWAKQYLIGKGIKDKEIISIVDERIRTRRMGRLD